MYWIICLLGVLIITCGTSTGGGKDHVDASTVEEVLLAPDSLVEVDPTKDLYNAQDSDSVMDVNVDSAMDAGSFPLISLFFDYNDANLEAIKNGWFGILGKAGPGAPAGLEGPAVPLKPVSSKLYAPFPGIVTTVFIQFDMPDEARLFLRYGDDFSIVFHHVTHLRKDIYPGIQLERGEVIGEAYIPGPDDGSFSLAEVWFLKRAILEGGKTQTFLFCPRPYFDDSAKSNMDALYTKAKYPNDPSPKPDTYCLFDEMPTIDRPEAFYVMVSQPLPQAPMPFDKDHLKSFMAYTPKHPYFEFMLTKAEISAIGGTVFALTNDWLVVHPAWQKNGIYGVWVLYYGIDGVLPVPNTQLSDGQILGTSTHLKFVFAEYVENEWRIFTPELFLTDKEWLETVAGGPLSNGRPQRLIDALGFDMPPP